MGKSKRGRHGACRMEPTGLMSVRQSEVEEEELPPLDRVCASVTNIVEKLQSDNASERECACSTLTALIGQPRAINQLLQVNAIKILGPLVVDTELTVRESALGALRNLSIEGGWEVCETMVKQDVMTPMVALLQQYSTDWVPENVEHPDRDSATNVLVQAVNLLWNLCENSSVAVRIFNEQNFLASLLPRLNANIYGHDLSIAIAQCLFTVTEDNNDAATQAFQGQGNVMAILQETMSAPAGTPQQLLLKTLCAGILHNVRQKSGGIDVASVLQILAESLQEEITLRLSQIAQTINTLKELNSQAEDAATNMGEDSSNGDPPSAAGTEASGEAEMDEDGEEKEDTEPAADGEKKHLKFVEDELKVKHRGLDEQVDAVCAVITAQQVALEMITNLACSDEDDDGEWEDEGSEESFGDGDAAVAEEMEENEESNGLPAEIQSAFTTHGIVQKVLAKIEPHDPSVCEVLVQQSSGERVLTKLETLQNRALFCVNNLVDILEPDVFGGTDHLYGVWMGLSKLVTEPTVLTNLERLEAFMSAMRAIAESLVKHNANSFSGVTVDDLQFLVTLTRECEDEEVRACAIRILAIIGITLAKPDPPHPLIKDIGVCLMEVISREKQLWVVAEALDSIFDVFGADHTDPVIKEINLVAKLQELAPLLKSKVQQQKRQLGEHLPIVMTARQNLMRFIKYKKLH